MTGLEARIDALSPEKRRLLEHLRSRRGGEDRRGGRETVEPFSMLSPADRERLPAGLEDAYPVASMQLGMLYHMALTQDDPVPAYHNVFLFRIGFPVDDGLLQRALQRVVDRHPVLRTSFDLTRYSEPLQLVHRHVPVELHRGDLRALPEEDRRRALDRFMERENRNVLDPRRAPLMRFRLLRCGAEDSYLAISECHAIAEGWSTLVTLGEIRETYFALAAGEEPDPGPPPLPYREFVHLERQARDSEETRRYWARVLDGARPVRPPRWPRPFRRQSRTADRKRFYWIEPRVAAGLERLAADLGVPLKSVLLAAHMKVMGAVNGLREPTAGLHTHGRPEREGGEMALGLFNNTVPFRLSLAAGTWRDLVQRAYEAEMDLLPHRRFPMAELQRMWDSSDPLVEVAFVYLHYHLFDEYRQWGDDRIEDLGDTNLSVTHFPLAILFSRWSTADEARLLLLVERDDTEVTAAQAEALHGWYGRVLAAMAAEPAARHDHFPVPTAAERHWHVVERNSTGPVAPPAESALDSVRRQALRRPEATAMELGDRRLAYGELDRWSAAIAGELRRLGITPEARVGLLLGRSPELTAGALGVMRAGGAFVPLDPAAPAERLEFLIRDSGLVALLAPRGAAVPPAGDLPVLDPAAVEPLAEMPPAGALPDFDPQRLAYVMYTSGSTGRPKGVAVRHGGLANLVSAQKEIFGITAGDRLLQFSSPSFDLSVWETFMALTAGAALVVAAGEELLAGAPLFSLLRDGGVTCATLTPSALASLPEGGLEALHTLIVAGEACPPELVDRWAPGRRFVNAYGPTEVTVCATAGRCEAGQGRPAIGRRLPGFRTYVLDPALRPVAPAVAGELCVSGAGLARGYLGRPARTAATFVPDPFSSTPGARMYRTGDRVRLLPDGRIDFLGRLDQQVKLRGYRIEPGEIEARLREHDGLREAVVEMRRDGGDARLVAYVVARGEGTPTVGELRRFLRRRLPEHMIPAAVVELPELPLTLSGKVDRRALPAPSSARPDLEHVYVPPADELERRLAEVWSQVLGIERVGVEDSFFELGGDSLQLLRVQARVQEVEGELEGETRGAGVPVATLFRHPTVRSLAGHLRGGEGESASREAGEERAAARRAARSKLVARRRQRRAARADEETQDD